MLPAFPKPKQVEGKIELSPAQLRRERKRRWEAGDRTCHLCRRLILDFENYCLDHVKPASGIGAKRDSQAKNLLPAHVWPCNFFKGSRRDLENVRRELRERYA